MKTKSVGSSRQSNARRSFSFLSDSKEIKARFVDLTKTSSSRSSTTDRPEEIKARQEKGKKPRKKEITKFFLFFRFVSALKNEHFLLVRLPREWRVFFYLGQ